MDTVTREFPRQRWGQEKGGSGIFCGQYSTTPSGRYLQTLMSPWTPEAMEFGAILLVPKCWKNYSFPSGVLLGACVCPSAAAAWCFIICLMKAAFLCEKMVSVKLPFSAKGTALSARVTNNVPFPDFLIKFFHWRQDSRLVISVEEWLRCFSLELHRNHFRHFIFLTRISGRVFYVSVSEGS